MKHAVEPRTVRLEVAIPVSVVSNEPSLQLKTIKIGLIARALAIFRVDRLHVYLDPQGDRRDAELLRKLVAYMQVAPYLRKRIFKLTPELRYAGLLPPLQLSTHGVGGPQKGEIREALVVERRGRRVVVEAGLGEEVEADTSGCESLPQRGERVLVELVELEPPRLRLVCDKRVYSGFDVRMHNSLKQLLLTCREYLRLATSRKGVEVVDVIPELLEKVSQKPRVLVVLGAPKLGLYELAEFEGFNLEDYVDYVVNTIPSQGVVTVRTEEALTATLAILNILLT